MVSASLWGCLLDVGSMSLQAALSTNSEIRRKTRKDTSNPLCNNYCSKDGKWFQIASKQSDKNWPELCKAIGLEAIVNDERFNSSLKRQQNSKEVISILDKAFATKTFSEIEQSFKGKNVHWAPMRSYFEITGDPQAYANGYIVESEHRQRGPMKVVGEPIFMSKTPPKIAAGTPELGEHTEEKLLELGYSWEDIAQFKEKKVIA